MTDKVYDNVDDLLVKVLLGEASETELEQAQHWVSLHPENERYFADFRRIWEESRKLAVQSTVSEDDAWNNFRRRVGADVSGGADGADTRETDGGSPVIRRMAAGRWYWLRVAAVLLVFVGGSWLYYKYGYQPTQFIAMHSGDRVLADTLPEGTIVTLNKQSSIRYGKSLAGSTRAVELEGEAFFNVAPDKNRPFVVYANGVLIKVIGTSFNVKTAGPRATKVTTDGKTKPGGTDGDGKTMTDGETAKNTTEVIVETGRVEVTSDQHHVSLGAHEKVLVGGNDRRPVKEENRDELYNYYRTHEFECNGIPLGRLVEKLNEVYKIHVVIGDSRLRDLRLTTTLGEESPDEILYVITRTLKITMVRNGKDIILK